MALTPEDVRNKQFATVRLTQGYEMDEVDEFLDTVEVELTRLLRENDDLRKRLASRPAEPAAPVQPVAAPAPAPVAAPPPPPAPAPTDAAVRMLELAQRTADEHVAQAKAEAEQLLADARAKHLTTVAELESQRDALQGKVEDLKAFEREYRTRLKTYLEGQLRELDAKATNGSPAAPAVAPAATPAGTGAAPAGASTSSGGAPDGGAGSGSVPTVQPPAPPVAPAPQVQQPGGQPVPPRSPFAPGPVPPGAAAPTEPPSAPPAQPPHGG